jgi:hypothetical protein
MLGFALRIGATYAFLMLLGTTDATGEKGRIEGDRLSDETMTAI